MRKILVYISLLSASVDIIWSLNSTRKAGPDPWAPNPILNTRLQETICLIQNYQYRNHLIRPMCNYARSGKRIAVTTESDLMHEINYNKRHIGFVFKRSKISNDTFYIVQSFYGEYLCGTGEPVDYWFARFVVVFKDMEENTLKYNNHCLWRLVKDQKAKEKHNYFIYNVHFNQPLFLSTYPFGVRIGENERHLYTWYSKPDSIVFNWLVLCGLEEDRLWKDTDPHQF